MPVPESAMDELENALLQLQEQGFLERVAAGDDRAASLAVRFAVFMCNPDGKPAGWGWLKKGGGKNIDGYAEDAAVYGNGPELDNVCDCIVGAGQKGAHIGLQRKPRRDSDKWNRPQPLTSGDLNYLRSGSGQGGNQPVPPPPKASIPPYIREDVELAQMEREIQRRYEAKGRGPDFQSTRWVARTMWDYCNGMPWQESVDKHLRELDEELNR